MMLDVKSELQRKLTMSSAPSFTPVAAKTQMRGTAVASGLNAVIFGIDLEKKYFYLPEKNKNNIMCQEK